MFFDMYRIILVLWNVLERDFFKESLVIFFIDIIKKKFLGEKGVGKLIMWLFVVSWVFVDFF